MVCSFCSGNHTVSTCPDLIEHRAQCIFTNGYDPLFSASDQTNRKWWFTCIYVKYRNIGWIHNRFGYNEYEGVQMIYENASGEEYKHVGQLLSEGCVPITLNDLYPTCDSIEMIAPSDRNWKAPPRAWFNNDHRSKLHMSLIRPSGQSDSKTARFRVLNRVKMLHEEHFRLGFSEIREGNVNDREIFETPPRNLLRQFDLTVENEENEPPSNPRLPERRQGVMLPPPDLTHMPPPPEDTQPTNVVVSDSTVCGICWDELGEANVMTTKCGHKFCCDCILSHFQNPQGNNCPCCRTEFAKRVDGWIPPVVEDEYEEQPRQRRRRGRPRRVSREVYNLTSMFEENETPIDNNVTTTRGSSIDNEIGPAEQRVIDALVTALQSLSTTR